MVWGRDNNTTFEPSKTHFTLISKRTSKKFGLCFPYPRLMFDGTPVKTRKSVKLVGCVFEEQMAWGEMIDAIAKRLDAESACCASLDMSWMATTIT